MQHAGGVTKKEQNVLFFTFFIVLLLIDQLSKALVRQLPVGASRKLLPGLWLTHAQNTGASFSILTGNNGLLAWFALIVLGILIYFYDKFVTTGERIAYVLLTAGILGNLIDRVLFGSVTDLFDLGWWPVFNIADSALVVGVLLLLVTLKKR